MTTPDPTTTAALRCPTCGSDAYLCDRAEHGTCTWAFHCRSKPHHNEFGEPGTQPPSSWDFPLGRTVGAT